MKQFVSENALVKMEPINAAFRHPAGGIYPVQFKDGVFGILLRDPETNHLKVWRPGIDLADVISGLPEDIREAISQLTENGHKVFLVNGVKELGELIQNLF